MVAVSLIIIYREGADIELETESQMLMLTELSL